MAQILVKGLTFSYEGSFDEIFTDVSFSVDTAWKLGFIGRNGKGKTTFLKLLMGEMEYSGTILSPKEFEYFPYLVSDPKKDTLELVEEWNPVYELWELLREMNDLKVDAEVLYRPFETLSQGERTKVMLAVLFLKEEKFLLIDEPTNHLDSGARKIIREYLKKKKGFILVSHDRSFLDGCIDHVLALNRNTIEVIQGNFSSWYREKERRDTLERQENQRLSKEITRLKKTARQAADWSKQAEKTKKGTKIGGLKPDRGYLGHKAAKMMKRAKQAENRVETTVREKETLLKDVERREELKLFPLDHHKEELVCFRNVTLSYGSEKEIVREFSMKISRGSRTALLGTNGCGKSTVIRALLEADQGNQSGCEQHSPLIVKEGELYRAGGLKISYVPQDASFLTGSLNRFAEEQGVDLTIFKTLLRKLDFSREQFEKDMTEFSAGQKKKVLLAKSLCEKAHLYIWDEPLNYIDLFSRIQLEELILQNEFTMLYVEHDSAFVEHTATQIIRL